jgi:hypothetical protein
MTAIFMAKLLLFRQIGCSTFIVTTNGASVILQVIEKKVSNCVDAGSGVRGWENPCLRSETWGTRLWLVEG